MIDVISKILEDYFSYVYCDTCKYGGKAWGNYVKGYGSPPGSQSTYPNKPFN